MKKSTVAAHAPVAGNNPEVAAIPSAIQAALEHPDTFTGMYQFWVQKRGMAYR